MMEYDLSRSLICWQPITSQRRGGRESYALPAGRNERMPLLPMAYLKEKKTSTHRKAENKFIEYP